jgi:cytochrome c oxidase subunit 2
VHGQTWPAIGTTQAAALADDWRTYGYAALAVALLVWGLILYAAIRFRSRPGHEQPRDDKKSNPPLEITWTILPFLLVTGLFVVTYHIETGVETLHAAPRVQIAVNAFRWGWTFHYLNGPTIDGDMNHPPQLVLPLGETAALQVTASDVDHSFWVPDFLFKRDAIPGRVTAFDLTPTKLGTFMGRCAELCGLGHTLMDFSVRVVPAAEFDRWMKGTRP